MTTTGLANALRACAYPLEAGVALLIANGTFLHREDFTSRFILHGTSGGIPMAAIDWKAAATTLAGGDCPAQPGNGVFFSCRPASPAASPSTSATPPQASTTTTSSG
jgi:hypothetical protein